MSKMLVAVEPRVAGFKEYTDRPIQEDEIKCKVLYAAPKHGTEVTEFRASSVHVKERYDSEWQLFVPRDENEDVYKRQVIYQLRSDMPFIPPFS